MYFTADELKALVDYFELLAEIDNRERDEIADERYNEIKDEGENS